MDHVFIDTSFFESENFFQGKVLRELFELGHSGEIQILITKIVYKEIKSRIHKSLERAKILINGIKKDGRATWLNSDHHSLLKLEVAKERERIYNELDEFLKYGNVVVIEYSKISPEDVFNNYFESKPPFGTKENKKHEFPDAFSLVMLEEWLSENKRTCLTISKDNDIQDYASKHLSPVEDPAKYLDAKIREIHERNKDRALALIETAINDFKDKILESIKDSLVEQIEQDLNYIEHEGRNIENVEQIEVNGLELDDFSVIKYEWDETLDEIKATLELSISFEFKADLGYENHDHAYWDSEDQKYYNVEYETQTVSQSETNRLILELDFSVKNEKPNLFDFNIEEIDPIELDEDGWE